MSGAWHHRIGAVGSALAVSEGMNMDVGDDAVTARAADFPKARQRGLADRDDASG